MIMICGCEITEVGVPVDNSQCSIHKTLSSEESPELQGEGCSDYRPERLPVNATDWPDCVCGEIAQEH